MIKRKRTISLLMMIFILALSVVPTIQASTDSLSPSEISGVSDRWMLKDSRIHRGSKHFTYYYENSEAESELKQYVENGISKWGSSISLTEGTSSNGDLKISIDHTKGAGYTSASKTDPNGTDGTNDTHCSSTEIKVNWENFSKLLPELSADQAADLKANTIAHEIGHVFGLDDIGNEFSIMYGMESHTKSVTEDDRNGMSVVTHVHTEHTFTYSAHDAAQHRATCSVCGGYKLEDHTFCSATGACIKCGQSCSHTYGLWADTDTTDHSRAGSECGYVQQQRHNTFSDNKCTICWHSGPITAGGIHESELENIRMLN